MEVTGKIAKEPAIRDKVIFSAIKIDNVNNPIQIVLFRKNRPAALSEFLSNAKLGDEITIIAKAEKNPYNNETQYIINNILNADQTEENTPCPTVF